MSVAWHCFHLILACLYLKPTWICSRSLEVALWCLQNQFESCFLRRCLNATTLPVKSLTNWAGRQLPQVLDELPLNPSSLELNNSLSISHTHTDRPYLTNVAGVRMCVWHSAEK